jgi:hypothetical protein
MTAKRLLDRQSQVHPIALYQREPGLTQGPPGQLSSGHLPECSKLHAKPGAVIRPRLTYGSRSP